MTSSKRVQGTRHKVPGLLTRDVLCKRMKKIGTWYFLLLAALFVLLGRASGYLHYEMIRTFQMHFDGRGFPVITTLIMRTYTWPYLAAALCAALAALGFSAPIKSHILVHLAFWIGIATCVILLATAFAYCLPFIPIVSEISK